MSATDELRRMLDERGVEWKDYGYENHTWWSDGNGIGWHAENRLTSNGPFVKIDGVLTPEQAIAATLGSEFNLDGLPVGLTISDDSNLLNWRGENYVKQSTLGSEVNGDTSDGYHTFNELYYHRTALFACLVALQPRQMAFKSWKHSDGTMYEGMFIAGIYTSRGWCTYHCEAKWWPLFDCHEQEFAPEWDGHTPSDAIHRLMSDFLPSQDVSGEVSE